MTRNWSKSYVLWALATDENHGPHVGGCGTCRGLVTIDLSKPGDPVKTEPDYYALGQASKFLLPGAVRIASDEPAGTQLKDVAFSNPDGSIVLYTLNAGTASQAFRIGFHGKTVATTSAGRIGGHVYLEAEVKLLVLHGGRRHPARRRSSGPVLLGNDELFRIEMAAMAGAAGQGGGGRLHLVHLRNLGDVVLLHVLGHGVHDAGHLLFRF